MTIYFVLRLIAFCLALAAVLIDARAVKLIAAALAVFFLSMLISGCAAGSYTVTTPMGGGTFVVPTQTASSYAK